MTCEDYLQDPETNASHLASCAMCRAIVEDLDEEVDVRHRPLVVDDLPLAPWEHAKERTWPLVAAGALSMLILSVVLFYAAGVSSFRGVTNAMISAVPPVQGLVKFFQYTGQAIGAPIIALLFIVMNTILFLLLRRAPKGIDV